MRVEAEDKGRWDVYECVKYGHIFFEGKESPLSCVLVVSQSCPRLEKHEILILLLCWFFK